MHEATVVGSLVSLLCDQAALHHLAAIRRVTLKVGRLAAVEPAALAACFDILAEDTPAAGAELVIEAVPIRVRCRDCDRESAVENFDFHCSYCQGSRLDIVAGRELRIESIEA
ncbi:MAG: hydrogenase maturation nickel metallochaperone HypA [Magnetospirillum sp.]|nr:hydrogenase maturation nickel metallochaperone HypA [Magnetospirillum sp.]